MSDNANHTTERAEGVAPTLSQASDTAKEYAQNAEEIYSDQAEALSRLVRESPLTAILIAAGAGYILGRIAR